MEIYLEKDVIRGSGFRSEGKTYLFGTDLIHDDAVFPVDLLECSHCGNKIKKSRSYQKVSLSKSFPLIEDIAACFESGENDDAALLFWISDQFYPTPNDFIIESKEMGFSLGVPWVPKGLEFNSTAIIFVHPKAIDGKEPGVFGVGVASEIHHIISDKTSPRKMKKLNDEGVKFIEISEKSFDD